jgi:hypothetical protein
MAGLPTTPGLIAGSYTAGQTKHQYTGVTEQALTGCRCVLALLILHEGARLNQTCPVSTLNLPLADAQDVVRADQETWSEDIKNINDMVANAECDPVYCYVELYLLRDIAKKKLERANANAAAVGLAAVPIPQPS